MKKIAVFAICVIFACAFVFLNLDNFDQYVPTDFSDTEMVFESETVPRYYYDKLSKEAKIAYTKILSSIRTHPQEIEIPSLNDEDFHEMFCALSYDNPEILCMKNESKIVSRGAKTYFIPQYNTEEKICEAHYSEMMSVVRTILSGVTADMDAYERELYFHDYICGTTVYQDSLNSGYSSYDALISGGAVCEGYARAMQLLLTESGIPNYLVTGMGIDEAGNSEGHMWNVVSIDGQAYYLDVTWNDLDSEEISHFGHRYFNVPQADILKNHTDLVPEENNCTATDANYFVREGLLFDAYDSATKRQLSRAIEDAARANKDTIEIRFTNTEAFISAAENLIDNGEIYDVLGRADRKLLQKYQEVIYVRDDTMCTLQFAFTA